MRHTTIRGLFAAAIAAALAVLAPVRAAEPRATPLRIVATTAMIGDIVREVSGDRAEVEILMGSGVDPHLYKATRSDIARLLAADAIFYNGLLLEGKMSDAFVRVATAGKPVYAVTELLDEASLLEPEEFAGHYDPHVWMDPIGWSSAVDVVAAKLSELDPAGAEAYTSRAAAYRGELARLHEYAVKSLNSVPAQSRVLVTAHDAFNYLARRYSFEVRGIQGISTESEAGVRDIEQIVSILVERKIPAVFSESTVADRNVKALIAGAAARSHTVRLGGELFSDAMGAPGTYEGTYIGMIDHNVTTITRALGGDAPERGMNGRLAPPESQR